MFSTVLSGATHGLQSYLMSVETDISDGLPSLSMVGFVSATVREAGERVRVALKNMGIRIPPSRITVNFSPADIPKTGIVIDLPVAIGILVCLGVVPQEEVEQTLFLGELSLDGRILPVRGVLPIVQEAKRRGIGLCILPKDNAREGAVTRGIRVVGFSHLRQLVDYLNADEQEREEISADEQLDVNALFAKSSEEEKEADFSDVHGQSGVKRVLEIAASGFHNCMMIGPPGSSKSMMARCIPSILPPLTLSESLEVSAIYSICGEISSDHPLITRRPFLSPHHSITPQAMTGGGTHPMPGILSKAHRGVLFMDEFPEFNKDVLNALRQPMEEHRIVVSRASGSYAYPARTLLAAAMNPCPCGHYPDRKKCTCTEPEIRRYMHRVPGPIVDRIDLCVDAPKVPVGDLMTGWKTETSAEIRERVMRARERQKARFEGTSFSFNADMDARAVEKFCILERREQLFVREIFDKMGLSARAYHKILKVARTIADLSGRDRITEDDLAEAVSYRMGIREKTEELTLHA